MQHQIQEEKIAAIFQTKIAACGYRIYKNLTWCNAKQADFVTREIGTDKESKKADPYCCAIKAMGICQEKSQSTYFSF